MLLTTCTHAADGQAGQHKQARSVRTEVCNNAGDPNVGSIAQQLHLQAQPAATSVGNADASAVASDSSVAVLGLPLDAQQHVAQRFGGGAGRERIRITTELQRLVSAEGWHRTAKEEAPLKGGRPSCNSGL